MRGAFALAVLLTGAGCSIGSGQTDPPRRPVARAPALPTHSMAVANFGADAPWYERNIPFLEIDDAEIQQIYYYRWKLFRSHVREIGEQGTTVVEFLENVSWARQPYTDLNDSASFHLLEGRWLRDPGIVDSLIEHEYTGGGNDRHFSEWIAAASEETTLVTGDPAPARKHLDTMQHIFNLWDDHLDRQRNLYWIEPLLDATEYTISSIDASGAGFTDKPSTDQNQNGFTRGFAFRPSINSYQYANAMAIARLATIAGQPETAKDYTHRAEAIRKAVIDQLWNPSLLHFTDRYERSTKYVTAGDFVRGRELVGYTPWMFELAPKTAGVTYSVAWKHALASHELGGPFGLRTVEPSYPKYMVQYRYDAANGLRECQWNGPSWPFQTSQALTGMANLLEDYPAAGVTKDDYLRLLRQYTHEHFLSPGHPDLQEDYDPDTGKPIVGLPRSHHYAHSTYVDLVLSGLLGIRPRADNVLEVNPLIPTGGDTPIRFFALEHLEYHGHDVGVIYDVDGKKYGIGKGLFVFVEGRRVAGPSALGKMTVPLPEGMTKLKKTSVDLAVNVGVPDGSKSSASSSLTPDGVAEAIDGRMWFFPEIVNGWSPKAEEPESWYAVEFGRPQKVASIELYFAEADGLNAPGSYRVQEKMADGWVDVLVKQRVPVERIAGGVNRLEFAPRTASALRVVFTKPSAGANFRLIELKAFGPE